MNVSKKVLITTLLATAPQIVLAAPPDYAALLTAADFSTTTIAIVAIGGIMAVVYVAWKGVGMVLGALRR